MPAPGGDDVEDDPAELAAVHARIDEAWRARQAEVAAEEPGPAADTPMWLSHHWPQDYDRCAVVAGRHVCRRCLAMYPVAAVAAVLAGLGWWWPRALDAPAIWLLPLPAVADFVADNLGWLPYSGRRQLVLSAVGALGAGAGYHRYLQHPGDPLVWTVVATYCAVCLLAAVVHARTR
ncbi:MAG: hypothetical protein JWM05_547 [Acidimicrobiales bacterium]|nr:hypothetical protein [Acidimicrobiales bacterium]